MQHEPTVYETSDVESDIDPLSQTQEHNEDIIESEIDFSLSIRRFNNEFIDGKVNFEYASDRGLGESGFKVSAHESDEQKISRISKELCELQHNLQQDPKVQELVLLAQKLKQKTESHPDVFHGQLTELFQDIDHLDSKLDSASAKSLESSQLAEIDRKIGALEQKLGAISTPLESTLKTLDRKVSIVNNPSYNVEETRESVLRLLESSEVAKLKTSDALTSYKHHKIDELVAHLPDLDRYAKSSDLILARLKSLNDVHLRAAENHLFVDNFSELYENMALEMSQWTKSLAEMDAKIDESAAQFDSNKQQINAWVAELQSQIKQLQ